MKVKKYILLLILALTFSSCAQKYSTRKRTIVKKQIIPAKTKTPIINIKSEPSQPMKEVESTKANSTTELVVNTALSYLGTPYKYTGTSRSGMDCSGLIYTSFQVADIRLNRSSHEIATQGKDISLKEARVGDLLFFKTSRKRAISHVGMIVEVGNSIKFIHSSTSKGVIISDLTEAYWKKAYVKAKRVL